ncbi:MAG: hypothetical protein M3372_00170, partial [Verrucomicrobiota bacterium]|nr:hypothetical protein [Verrucomicrobiota bacterium]
LLEYGALAKRCFRPLSHLTNGNGEYGVARLIVNNPQWSSTIVAPPPVRSELTPSPRGRAPV